MPLVSLNPATGRLIQRHRAHTAAQVSAALAASHTAFLAWSDTPLTARARHLRAVAATLRRQRTALARLITAEMGKPRADALAEIEKCAACCEFYAQHAAHFLRPVHPVGAPKNASVTFEPLGVILAVMPWNYPFWQAFRAAVPALLAGNTVLLKHASNVSGCALAIERIFTSARSSVPASSRSPANLLRTLLVSASQLPPLVADPRVRGVTLTGSTAAGFFYPATLLSGVRPGMPAYDDELFGPVAVVISARDETDAVRIANDTPYGLGAAVFSRNLRRARSLARRLDTGMIALNAQIVSHPALPFGGTKASGLGRELAGFGARAFVNIKTLTWS